MYIEEIVKWRRAKEKSKVEQRRRAKEKSKNGEEQSVLHFTWSGKMMPPVENLAIYNVISGANSKMIHLKLLWKEQNKILKTKKW